jgi:NAD kinase
MERLTENKIVLVTRRTRLDELIARFNTLEQARFYLEHLGADFADYQAEDQGYKAAVRATERLLGRLGRVQALDRAYVPNFLFGAADTVVVLGQDGLVANVLKYLDGQVAIGVNPDPARYEGVLVPFRPAELDRLVPEVFAGRRAIRRVTMAEATLNTGETMYGVNDLFIGPRSHTSARYRIGIGGRAEDQSSSGIVVSTGLGSTGWLRSILAGARGIAGALAGASLPLLPAPESFAWDADYLYFSVREPWPSRTSAAELAFGQITAATPLVLESQMAEGGVIFSDGIEADCVRFDAGTRATIQVAARQGRLAI